MKKAGCQSLIAWAAFAAVFLFQLARGFRVLPPEPGMIPSGGQNEPSVVVFSALLAGILSYGLVRLLFWGFAQIAKALKKKS